MRGRRSKVSIQHPVRAPRSNSLLDRGDLLAARADDRLDELLSLHRANPREHQDGSMQALIREADRWAGMVRDGDLRDAGLIASAQRIEHYEIAVYGTLATWAKQLGLDEDMRILLEILDEEKSTDERLTDLAKSVVNREAASA